MIGFGELRKFSVQWKVDVAAVERAYVVDWILKAIFDHTTLAQSLVLRGGAVLRYVYSAEFPIADDPVFLLSRKMNDHAIENALTTSLNSAATLSGLKFSLMSYERGSGKIEYTGPLGRRSAAQPRVTLSVMPGQTRLKPVRLALLHPFSDDCHATVCAVALDEFVGEHIAALARTPRARDVFNLWFVLTKLRERLNVAQVSDIAQSIAKEKNVALPRADAVYDATHRVTLERAWENALREVRGHPTFAQAENDLSDALKFIFVG